MSAFQFEDECRIFYTLFKNSHLSAPEAGHLPRQPQEFNRVFADLHWVAFWHAKR